MALTEVRRERGVEQAAPPSSRSVWGRFRRSDLAPALVFIGPWIIGFLWFQLYPVIAAVYYGFTAYNMMRPPAFIGLANYQQLFSGDDLFRQALVHSSLYALFSVPLDLVVAFVFAVLLNMRIPGRPILRAAFYFPAVDRSSSSAAAARRAAH